MDAAAAIATITPSTPQSLTVTPAFESLSASWSAPSIGGSMTSYAVEYTTDDSTWISAGSVTGTSTTIASLAPGTNYRVRVRASNYYQTGGWASSTLVQPLAPTSPSAPTALDVLADDTSLQVAWAVPVDNGGRAIDWYDVQYSTDDTTWVADDTTVAAATTIHNLVNGTPYRVRVRAHNAIGYGPWTTAPSPVSPQVLTAPSAPQSLGLSTSDTSVTANWTAPATTGGRPVKWYVVQHSTDDSTWIIDDTTTSTAATISGLANGTTYYVRVAAVNAINQGAWASEHAATTTPVTPPPGGGGGGGGGGGAPPPAPAPSTPPGAPIMTAARPGNAEIALAWQAPDDTGGAAITGYAIQLLGPSGDDTVAAAGTTATLTGLVNGATYAVRVAAVNSAGTGAWSAASEGLVPRTTPDAPTGLRALAGNGAVELTWSPPAFDGGDDITGYVVAVATKDAVAQYSADDTRLALAGLVNGTSYTIRVAALNAAGTGTWTAPATVTPVQPRVSAPIAVSASRKGRTVRVHWQAPLQGTPVRYLVSASINGRPWQLVGNPTGRSQSFTLPRAGLAVLVKVAAVDSQGRGPWSSAVGVRQVDARAAGVARGGVEPPNF